jgi:subtilisin family serine protease
MAARVKLLTSIALITLLASNFSVPLASPAAPWQAKVDPWVMDTAAEQTEFLVFLSEQADLSGAAELPTKLEKGSYVFQQLTEVAGRTQGPVLEVLAANGAEYRPYWIANAIWVRGDAELVESLARRPDVAHIYANPSVPLNEPEPGPKPTGPELQALDSVEWNIARIGAPELWEAGFTGQGVVIGGQDTGYEWSHPAIRDQYRGWNGISSDHNYNWHDAIHESINNWRCGSNAGEPCDDNGHGTHTMGIVLGQDGSRSNQIGVAPGATWIGCRNMDQGVGTPQTYLECYQWFLAPTDVNNENPDPSLSPDVINNSWGCPEWEGCTDPDILVTAVEAVRAAGIVSVHSAGNDGYSEPGGCGTVNTPAAIYDASFTVGNTDDSDRVAGNSSRGPVVVDGSGRLKPDIVAPGTGIRSSYTGGSYQELSGTSMAAPHVAGLVALLISAQPQLRGQVDEIERLIMETADPVTSPINCGDIFGSEVPNNVSGWGRINAVEAYNLALREYALLFSPEYHGITWAGGEIVYRHTLTNNTPAWESYQLTFTSSQGWGMIPAQQIDLEAGQSAEVTVSVAVPEGTPAGALDTSILTVTSTQLLPVVTATVTDTTVVGDKYFFPFLVEWP